MLFANHDTQNTHSNLEEYSYHCTEAEYHWQQIQKCIKEIEIHSDKLLEHSAYAIELCSKNFIA